MWRKLFRALRLICAPVFALSCGLGAWGASIEGDYLWAALMATAALYWVLDLVVTIAEGRVDHG